MNDFAGKVILITGGGTGVGAATAIGAATRGAESIILNYSRSEKEAQATAEKVRSHGTKAEVVKGDVSEDADCRKIAKFAEKFGRLDALVNCAGITKFLANHRDLEAYSKDDFMNVYAVNTVGAFQIVRACKPLLEKAAVPSVLLVSSLNGILGGGSSLAYATSKGALNTLTLSLAKILAPKIRVNAVCPGFIDTRWWSDSISPDMLNKLRDGVSKKQLLPELIHAEDIAESGLFLISPGGKHITGELLVVDAGLRHGPPG